MENPVLTFPSPVGHVLVVDDDRQVRHLLKGILESKGHRVTDAKDGRDALQKVATDAPDVIVLDVLMPHLDGLEVCRRLKTNPQTTRIHVFILTSLSERADRLKAIEAGANDFLTKPVDAQEVLLRVRNALYSGPLVDQVEERGEETARLREHVCVLTAIAGSLLSTGAGDPCRLFLMRERVDLVALLRQAAESTQRPEDRALITLDTPPGALLLMCDEAIIRRVLSILLEYALSLSPPRAEVNLRIQEQEVCARVDVCHAAPVFPPELQFRDLAEPTTGDFEDALSMSQTGTALTFCRLAVQAHGGVVGIQSQAGVGGAFWFTLPIEVDHRETAKASPTDSNPAAQGETRG